MEWKIFNEFFYSEMCRVLIIGAIWQTFMVFATYVLCRVVGEKPKTYWPFRFGNMLLAFYVGLLFLVLLGSAFEDIYEHWILFILK